MTGRVVTWIGACIVACALLPAGTALAQTGGAAPEASEQQNSAAKPEKKKEKDCAGGIPGVEQLCDAGEALSGLPGQVAGAPAQVAGSVAESAADQLTNWMTDAATWTTKQITEGIQQTSTPEIKASWYQERFGAMAALGLGLSLLVAMIALCSAALRRDPDALGATILGMLRAGFGTGLVIALTAMALKVGDGITNYVAGDTIGRESSKFWKDVGDAWGKDNFAGLGSSAIAFLLAFVQVIAGLVVWIEMLVRQAAIYVAVLFMPFALAAGIWPAMREWQSRLVKVLFVLIAMKPVVVTVLALAGYAAKAGITGEAERDIGVLLAAIVIFALAALSPWALLHLVSIDHEGTRSARGGAMAMRGSTGRIGGAALAASGGAAAMRTLNRGSGGGGGSFGGGASLSGGGSGGRPEPGGGGRPPEGGGGGPSSGRSGGGLPSAVNSTGAVAAAAGMGPAGAAASGSQKTGQASAGSGGPRGSAAQSTERAGGETQTQTAQARTNAADQRRPRPAVPASQPGNSKGR